MLFCWTVHNSLRDFRHSLATRIPVAPMERACISCFCLTVDQNEIQLFSMSSVLWHIVKLLQRHSSCSPLSSMFFQTFPLYFSFTSSLSLSFVLKHMCQWGPCPTAFHPRGCYVKRMLKSVFTNKGNCILTQIHGFPLWFNHFLQQTVSSSQVISLSTLF